MQAKSAGMDVETIESLSNKLKLESYQNSPENIRNHSILLQLRRAILHTLMAADSKNLDALHTLLTEIKSHLYAIIQAEPKLQQPYLQHDHYSSQFDAFYDFANKKETYEFLAEKKDTGSYQVKNSDLKTVICCVKSTDPRPPKRNEVICAATADYTPPEWNVDYEFVERSPLPAHNAHRVGEIYYDSKTHQFSVLGHDGEFHEGRSEALGDKRQNLPQSEPLSGAYCLIWINSCSIK